ncbi:hypothetical protein GGR92_001151 [Spirosoma lacussanchae]|uniref:hypothetical protein n=1 Tax=Spirosoma lacussanchae TaxID=1884249 RepID=UPI0011092261|nr:hypothetical protein [Spirosoma lacussanchae]
MKKIPGFIAGALALLMLYACDNSIDKVFDEETLVEFNEAILRTNATGRPYSITALPNSVTAGSSSVATINLVGRQRTSDLTVRVFVDPTATTASPNSYTLSNGGNVTIPGGPNGRNVGSLTVTVGRATSSTAPIANLVLVIDSTSTEFKPSQNYKRLGYSFRQ